MVIIYFLADSEENSLCDNELPLKNGQTIDMEYIQVNHSELNFKLNQHEGSKLEEIGNMQLNGNLKYFVVMKGIDKYQ